MTQKNLVILENIRSAYNVGTIIRTADALGWQVICSGYSPDHHREPKVLKSSLWAEQSAFLCSYRNTLEALHVVREQWYVLVAAEITSTSISLDQWQISWPPCPVALVMGSETDGVLPETLSLCDHIIHIPMIGIKESLNVAEAAAIMMWEIY
jgi:23S rRNA (guanosine2251-2'-O)-methyltransferase